MRTLLLPITLLVVVVGGIMLMLTANLSRALSWVSEHIAAMVVNTILWQRSSFLLGLITPHMAAKQKE